MNVIEKAKDFAIRYHGSQEHGCLTIVDHLTAVTDKLKQFYRENNNDVAYADETIAAGWLHDVIEDTPVTYQDLGGVFGFRIANIVDAVTDGEGKNRLERHMNTYWRTRENQQAILVKMCDRWHNQKRSLENKEKYASMYAKEYIYFKFALYRPGRADVLWDELDAQYEQLKNV